MIRIAIAWSAALAFVCVLLILAACSPQSKFTDAKAGSVVKVVMEKGHGSAFHIGGGYFVSAAHVVGEATETTLKGDDGRTVKAEVLWVNAARDIAFLKADGSGFERDRLSCEVQPVGSSIYARGNPLSMEFVRMWGRIAGVSREVGPWKRAYVTDMTILPGMSGGGVYNQAGEVIGISIGVANARLGFGVSLTGMTFVVPSTAVCEALGRI